MTKKLRRGTKIKFKGTGRVVRHHLTEVDPADDAVSIAIGDGPIEEAWWVIVPRSAVEVIGKEEKAD